MTFSREPRIHCVSIMTLRPTQITVGMREVKAKRKSWREHPDRKKADFLGNHLIPVIWGPKEEYYVIDHHHLTLALHQEGVKEIATTVVADLRRLPREAFWVFLDNRGWLHPFDEHGRRRSYDDLPKRIPAMVDDPYRSLAGEVRKSGGCSKETTPFSEFLWADYLRRRLKRKLLVDDFPAALVRALKLARSSDADFLPGWCGPIA
ncbi:MAG TPA: ParB-like protein [Steroidobacteraceae bacterium]|jgi:hypothetical protein|nr:ParB-like protein [Steroidobacteraceae bacterium]